MYLMLQYFEQYNDGQVEAYNEIQTEATYGYFKQNISDSELFKSLNRKKRTRLAYRVFCCVRDDVDFTSNLTLTPNQDEFLYELTITTRHKIACSKFYLTNNTGIVTIEECFRPNMSTAIKKYKLFNLVPQYSFKSKYVDIDFRDLKQLLRKARKMLNDKNALPLLLEQRQQQDTQDNDNAGGNDEDRDAEGDGIERDAAEGDDEEGGFEKHLAASYAFSQVFDFEKVRLKME